MIRTRASVDCTTHKLRGLFGLLAAPRSAAILERRVWLQSSKPSLERKVGRGNAQALNKNRGQRTVEMRTKRWIGGAQIFERYHIDHTHPRWCIGNHPRTGRRSVNEGHLSEELAGTQYGQDRFGLAAPA